MAFAERTVKGPRWREKSEGILLGSRKDRDWKGRRRRQKTTNFSDACDFIFEVTCCLGAAGREDGERGGKSKAESNREVRGCL